MNARQIALENVTGQSFMLRVAVGMQEAHGDRFDAAFLEQRDDRVQRGRVNRDQNIAARIDALGNRNPQLTLDQRQRFLPVQVVRHRDAYAAQLEDVAKSRRSQQCAACTLALENRIGCNRCGMNDFGNLAGRRALLLAESGHAFDDRCRIVRRRRWLLALVQRPIRTQENEVGERAADVCADTQRTSARYHADAGAICKRGSRPARSFTVAS